jgi:hypothetical protein
LKIRILDGIFIDQHYQQVKENIQQKIKEYEIKEDGFLMHKNRIYVPSEYDFDIKHIKGKVNKVVDALSRRVHLMHAIVVSMH